LPRFPVAFRLPAFASQVIRPSLGDWAFLAVGLPATGTWPGSHRGSHVPHARDATGVGASCISGAAVLNSADKSPADACRFPAASPCSPPGTLHRRGSRITRHQRRFTRFTRPVCPLPVTPRMEQGSFGFPPELRTPPLPATHAEGGARPSSTGLRLRIRHQAGPPICESARYMRPRVATSSWCPRSESAVSPR